MDLLTTVPLLTHRRPGNAQAAADRRRELLEIIMRRYERASTL